MGAVAAHAGWRARLHADREPGAVGVGRGTTKAMVYSSLAILIVNFFLTMALSLVFPV
jgi:ABC-type transporter Mla maintaining outer membrane lipid asymmetry permease subunit MlaE